MAGSMLLRPFNLFGFSTTARRLLRRVTIELAFALPAAVRRNKFIGFETFVSSLFSFFLFWRSVEIIPIRDIVERAF